MMLAKKEKKTKSVCIICRQEKEGSPVLDDPYIIAVRAIKARLGHATGNRLVVCAADIPKWREKRKRFEKYLMWYGLLAFLLFVAFLFLSPTLVGFIYVAIGMVVVMAFSLLTYFPAIRGEKEKKQ